MNDRATFGVFLFGVLFGIAVGDWLLRRAHRII